ncbi:MAG: T9SS type A sorting domain-containing protein [Bacteroidetes bacterium]|nr:T9SS type A sorting domain-containing protein [Bacteroidota bacterium]
MKTIILFLSSLILVISYNNLISQTGWINQTIGTRNYVAINFINNNSGYIIGDDGVILKTTNQGMNWIVNTATTFGPPLKAGFVLNENKMGVIAGGTASGMVWTSTNAGVNWTSGISDIVPIGSPAFIWLREISMINENVFFVCGNEYGMIGPSFYVDGIIFKTTNSGLNWFESFRAGVDYYDIEFKDINNGATKGASFLRTANGGSTWEDISGLPTYDGKMSNPFLDTIFMTDTRGIVIRSTNGGNLFHNVPTNNTKPLRNLYFHDTKQGHVVGDSGTILFTSDAGSNWSRQVSNTFSNLRGIWFLNRDTGFVVGDNGMIMKTFNRGIMVSTYNNSEVIPNKYWLYQNFPNPFNPSTTIKYQLSVSGFVSLRIYDVLGNMVKKLVNKIQPTGNYEFFFEANNLSSGVYFYSLWIDEMKVDTKQFVFLK